MPKWSESELSKTIRTGVDPTEHMLGEGMPWKDIAAFASDDDLKAMYTYLHGLTPIESPKK